MRKKGKRNKGNGEGMFVLEDKGLHLHTEEVEMLVKVGYKDCLS